MMYYPTLEIIVFIPHCNHIVICLALLSQDVNIFELFKLVNPFQNNYY